MLRNLCVFGTTLAVIGIFSIHLVAEDRKATTTTTQSGHNIYRIRAKEASIKRMKKRADEVLKMNNISARVHIETVMQLADCLAKEGQSKEAAKYYKAGLRHFPLDLKRQLALGRMLMKMGKKKEAMERARIVAKMAEEDNLVLPARKMLGKKVDTKIKAIGKMGGKAPTIILVPMGKVDVLLVRDVQKKLQKQLGISVLIRSVPLTMPSHGRDPFHDFCQDLRKQLKEIKATCSPVQYKTMLKQAKVREADLKQDEKVVQLFQRLLDQSKDEKVSRNFAAIVAEVRTEERQWNSLALLKVLRKATKAHKQNNVRFIGVTRCDIYGKNTSFLLANGYLGEIMVMSYRRFMSSFTHETVNRNRLLKRMVNQALSSCGKVFGIDGCTDPSCPRAYPHSVAEHDAKSDKLCNKCRKAFDKVFGRK